VEFVCGKLIHAHDDRSGIFFKAVTNIKRVTKLNGLPSNAFFLTFYLC